MGRATNSSSSSSIDSTHHPCLSSASSLSQPQRDLSTDLRLGLDISNSPQDTPSCPREQSLDWPRIKPQLRRSLLAEGNNRNHATLFVKVYMEGIPIGRKLDLLAHDSYHGLIRTLDHMFSTTILGVEADGEHSDERYDHVLTYEDKEGDWLIVGDVPWEMLVTSVKRLKITRADKC